MKFPEPVRQAVAEPNDKNTGQHGASTHKAWSDGPLCAEDGKKMATDKSHHALRYCGDKPLEAYNTKT